MNVVQIAPSQIVNHGKAVVDPPPLSLASSRQMVLSPPAEPSPIPSAAASVSAEWLDVEWSTLRSDLVDALSRIARPSIDIDEWYETPGDALYPVFASQEILSVQVVDDSTHDAFSYTDTDFDVWT